MEAAVSNAHELESRSVESARRTRSEASEAARGLRELLESAEEFLEPLRRSAAREGDMIRTLVSGRRGMAARPALGSGIVTVVTEPDQDETDGSHSSESSDNAKPRSGGYETEAEGAAVDDATTADDPEPESGPTHDIDDDPAPHQEAEAVNESDATDDGTRITEGSGDFEEPVGEEGELLSSSSEAKTRLRLWPSRGSKQEG